MRKVYNKMRNEKGFLLSAFCFLILVSCENEDFVPQDDIGDVVEVTAAIGDAPHTRVSQPEDNKYVFDDKDKIHIVGWYGYEDWNEDLKWHFKAPDGGSSRYNWWNDAVSTYDATSGKWRTEPYMRWQNGGYDLKHYFIAWWPENVVESTADLEKVNINLTGNYKTDDILLAQEYDKKKPDDNKLNLKFEHLMSRLDVHLRFREYYTDVKDITVSANLYTEATCDFFRRTTQTTGTTKTVNLTESVTMSDFDWSGACITVPQEINLHDIGLTINFTAGGEQKKVILNESKKMTFESGKRIILYLTIGNDAVNGNSIFLPAAGVKGNDAVGYGYYWSNTLDSSNPSNAWAFGFDSDSFSNDMYSRQYGCSIRAIRVNVQ